MERDRNDGGHSQRWRAIATNDGNGNDGWHSQRWRAFAPTVRPEASPYLSRFDHLSSSRFIFALDAVAHRIREGFARTRVMFAVHLRTGLGGAMTCALIEVGRTVPGEPWFAATQVLIRKDRARSQRTRAMATSEGDRNDGGRSHPRLGRRPRPTCRVSIASHRRGSSSHSMPSLIAFARVLPERLPSSRFTFVPDAVAFGLPLGVGALRFVDAIGQRAAAAPHRSRIALSSSMRTGLVM